jgi:hypothetical protein
LVKRVNLVFGGYRAYRDKKVVGVFVRFRAPLHQRTRYSDLSFYFRPALTVGFRCILITSFQNQVPFVHTIVSTGFGWNDSNARPRD